MVHDGIEMIIKDRKKICLIYHLTAEYSGCKEAAYPFQGLNWHQVFASEL